LRPPVDYGRERFGWPLRRLARWAFDASGWLADRIGRKAPLMISILWHSTCNFTLLGIGMGSEWPGRRLTCDGVVAGGASLYRCVPACIAAPADAQASGRHAGNRLAQCAPANWSHGSIVTSFGSFWLR